MDASEADFPTLISASGFSSLVRVTIRSGHEFSDLQFSPQFQGVDSESSLNIFNINTSMFPISPQSAASIG
jgi:hypothetical protein